MKRGGIGVLLTDTIYGVVGRAFSKRAVQRIYRLKERNPEKPFIILISSYADLKKFNVKPLPGLKKHWPGKVSIILDAPSIKFRYLHRGTGSLAFRMPGNVALRRLLRRTGPLVAPSANPEGKPPARNVREAQKHFGRKVDFYLDGGTREGKPSRLMRMSADGSVEVLRR